MADFILSDTAVSAKLLSNMQIKQWEAETQLAAHNVKLHRSLSLPKFEIGYRQDMNTGQTFYGFHAGITIPYIEYPQFAYKSIQCRAN